MSAPETAPPEPQPGPPPAGTGTVRPAAFAVRPIAAVCTGFALVLTLLSPRYGFHRDELYFLTAGRHPDWGYIDQPPLAPILGRLSTLLFGQTPAGLRVAATLGAVGIVIAVALIARELGGGKGPQVLAALATTVSGFVLAVGHMVSTSTFDPLLWLLLIWVALRIMRTGSVKLWPVAGAIAGVGVLNKYLIALPVAAMLAAIAITGPRRVLRSRWLLAGVAVAVVVALPTVLWQIAHGFPQLTVAGGISADDGLENRILFVPMQLVYLSPVLAPVWIAGWLRVWRTPELRWARPVALAYPLLCVAVLAGGGKPYYVMPFLLVLTAAGCVPAYAWLRGGGPARRVLQAALVLVGAASSVVMTLPVLPPGPALNAVDAVNPEQGEQYGWPSFVDTVAEVWRGIPEQQRGSAVVLAQNYGEAGALDVYGPERGLPRPYSDHMSFADWGPPPDTATGPVLLVRQKDSGPYPAFLTGCAVKAAVDNGSGVENEEQGAEVSLCTGATAPWSAIWPTLHHYY